MQTVALALKPIVAHMAAAFQVSSPKLYSRHSRRLCISRGFYSQKWQRCRCGACTAHIAGQPGMVRS